MTVRGIFLTSLTWDILFGDGEVITAKTNGVETSYTYGLERISALTGKTKTEYIYDGRGSVAAEVSYNTAWYTLGGSLSKKNVTTKSYTPFGEQIGEAASGYGYNGEYYNAATGMIYLRARFYEPEMNRFSQKDIVRGTMLNAKSLNRYTYVQNDPINFIDPSGESLKSALSSVGSKISSAAKSVGSAISTAAKAVGNAVSTAAKAVGNAAKSAYNTVSNAISSVVNKSTSSGSSGSSGSTVASYTGGHSGGNSGINYSSNYGNPYYISPLSSNSGGYIDETGWYYSPPTPTSPTIKNADEETLKKCENGPKQEVIDWGPLLRGAGRIATGAIAVAAGVGVIAAGGPALIIAVAVGTTVAGGLTFLNGSADIQQGITGNNYIRDSVFNGNQKSYDIYSWVTETVAAIGTVICLGYSASSGSAANNTTTSEFDEWLNKGNADNTVYFGSTKGEFNYTGITKQPLEIRLAQHNGNGKNFERLVPQVDNLTRNQARAIEQYYIENGPNELNKINSIAKNNIYYDDAINWAKNFLGE